MIRKIYQVTHKKQKLSFLFKYSLKGNITEFKSDFVMSNEMVKAFKELMPFFEQELEKFTKDKWEVELIENGISFTAFWNGYNYKQGGAKKDAKRAWDNLSEVKQAKAIVYIPRYDNYLKRTGVAKAHGSTYLNKEYFDNE